MYNLRRKLNSFRYKYAIVVIISLVFINEFFLFEYCYLKWLMKYGYIQSTSENDEIRFLLVSDPQMIGFEHENKPFPGIIRYDADKFLEHGFTRAIRYSKPHFIVFLGDIFDEGEIGSEAEMNEYVTRFNNVFTYNTPDNVKTFVIPGDNDIGGEGEIVRIPLLSERFQRLFGFKYPSINFTDHFNIILADVSDEKSARKLKQLLEDNAQKLRNKINILANHANDNLIQLETKVPISLFLTGHTHESNYILCRNCIQSSQQSNIQIVKKIQQNLYSYKPLQFRLKTYQTINDVLKITVPTCSYRMGVTEVGYGLLSFNVPFGNQKVLTGTYRMLWLPYRFSSLFSYIFIAPIFAICVLKFLFRKIRCSF